MKLKRLDRKRNEFENAISGWFAEVVQASCYNHFKKLEQRNAEVVFASCTDCKILEL